MSKECLPAKPQFMSFTDMLAEPIKVKKLVGKIIQRGCTCQLFGPSGHGKTFVALDISLAVATGGQWNGIKCEQGLVIYFNGEGREGFKLRCRAWQMHHGTTDQMGFHSSCSSITFDVAGLLKVTTEVRALEAMTGQKVALIVIDTLARHLIGDENSTRDMSEFVRTVDDFRDTFVDSTVLIIHHTGVSTEAIGRSRGSSALKAALDVEIQCHNGVLTFTKMKDTAAPTPIEFKLKIIDLGIDEDSEPVDSCIVEYGEVSAKKQQVKTATLTSTEKFVLKVITDTTSGLVSDAKAEYCKRVQTNSPDDKPDSARRSFDRAVKSLIEKGEIFMDAKFVRIGQPDNTGQRPDTSEIDDIESGRTRAHSLKECPLVQVEYQSVINQSDLEVATLAYNEGHLYGYDLPFPINGNLAKPRKAVTVLRLAEMFKTSINTDIRLDIEDAEFTEIPSFDWED